MIESPWAGRPREKIGLRWTAAGWLAAWPGGWARDRLSARARGINYAPSASYGPARAPTRGRATVPRVDPSRAGIRWPGTLAGRGGGRRAGGAVQEAKSARPAALLEGARGRALGGAAGWAGLEGGGGGVGALRALLADLGEHQLGELDERVVGLRLEPLAGVAPGGGREALAGLHVRGRGADAGL